MAPGGVRVPASRARARFPGARAARWGAGRPREGVLVLVPPLLPVHSAPVHTSIWVGSFDVGVSSEAQHPFHTAWHYVTDRIATNG